MSCPTCDHTMQKIGVGIGKDIYWCPRCGTLKTLIHRMERDYNTHEVPKAVKCIRSFIKMISNSPEGRYLKGQTELSGVLESTNTPVER